MIDMAERFSIYAGPPIMAALNGIENRSGRLNEIAERYLEIVAAELRTPRFSRDEWCAIMDVLNGAQIEVGGDDSWQLAWANVADSPELDEKWGVDHTDLAARMRALSTGAKAAIYEAAARFWRAPECDTDEMLADIGIVFR